MIISWYFIANKFALIWFVYKQGAMCRRGPDGASVLAGLTVLLLLLNPGLVGIPGWGSPGEHWTWLRWNWIDAPYRHVDRQTPARSSRVRTPSGTCRNAWTVRFKWLCRKILAAGGSIRATYVPLEWVQASDMYDILIAKDTI